MQDKPYRHQNLGRYGLAIFHRRRKGRFPDGSARRFGKTETICLDGIDPPYPPLGVQRQPHDNPPLFPQLTGNERVERRFPMDEARRTRIPQRHDPPCSRFLPGRQGWRASRFLSRWTGGQRDGRYAGGCGADRSRTGNRRRRRGGRHRDVCPSTPIVMEGSRLDDRGLRLPPVRFQAGPLQSVTDMSGLRSTRPRQRGVRRLDGKDFDGTHRGMRSGRHPRRQDTQDEVEEERPDQAGAEPLRRHLVLTVVAAQGPGPWRDAPPCRCPRHRPGRRRPAPAHP